MAEMTKSPASLRGPVDFFLILVASCVLTMISVYLLRHYDVIHFTGRAESIGRLPNFVFYHLRSSVLFFAADLFFFIFTLRALSRRLGAYLAVTPAADQRSERLAAIYSLDSRADMAITIFFGIGVIYTAIGMESALLNALGGIHGAEDAARQGAWEILRKLVDGGLILALSTTICGGVGGYAMRLLKHGLIGRRLTLLDVIQQTEYDQLLHETAARVRGLQDQIGRPDDRAQSAVQTS